MFGFFLKNFHNHYKSLGNWSFGFYYYYDLGITSKVDSPGIFEMEKVIDPKSIIILTF